MSFILDVMNQVLWGIQMEMYNSTQLDNDSGSRKRSLDEIAI